MSSGASTVTTRFRSVVCDTGPVIHLDEMNSLDLLAEFPEVVLVPAVASEVARLRPSALSGRGIRFTVLRDDIVADEALRATCRSFSLDAAETEALALIGQMPDSLFLTDDAAARLVAEQMGFRVHGTIGVLIRSIRRGQRNREEVLATLERIPVESSLHIKPVLLEEIIDNVRKEFGAFLP
jgi:predicted nucleic acid-binding protein